MMKEGGPAAALWSRAYPLLTVTALCWAGNSIVGRAARDLVPPAALSFWRWTFALALLLPLAWPHLKRDWPVLRELADRGAAWRIGDRVVQHPALHGPAKHDGA